jgi:hypothetical protein
LLPVATEPVSFPQFVPVPDFGVIVRIAVPLLDHEHAASLIAAVRVTELIHTPPRVSTR